MPQTFKGRNKELRFHRDLDTTMPSLPIFLLAVTDPYHVDHALEDTKESNFLVFYPSCYVVLCYGQGVLVHS